jgi:hypothetical protein
LTDNLPHYAGDAFLLHFIWRERQKRGRKTAQEPGNLRGIDIGLDSHTTMVGQEIWLTKASGEINGCSYHLVENPWPREKSAATHRVLPLKNQFSISVTERIMYN